MKQKKDSKDVSENIIWFGTSISKALDRTKFERDTKTKVKFVKAFGIRGEENQFYPDKNFADTVPKEVEQSKPDAIVLQGGSIEISNIDVKAALMDTEKDIEHYRNEWTAKIEEDSENLYNIAEKALEQNQDMKVIIVKRLPRFDPINSDPKGIKSQLSNFGNHVLDQLWIKKGRPQNIQIVEFEIGCSGPGYLKDLIYGSTKSQYYDGINLNGSGAQRHFTYRAVCATKAILLGKKCEKPVFHDDYHTNCPQSQYQRRQFAFRHPRRFIKTNRVRNDSPSTYQYGQNYYSVPVSNRFLGNF